MRRGKGVKYVDAHHTWYSVHWLTFPHLHAGSAALLYRYLFYCRHATAATISRPFFCKHHIADMLRLEECKTSPRPGLLIRKLQREPEIAS